MHDLTDRYWTVLVRLPKEERPDEKYWQKSGLPTTNPLRRRHGGSTAPALRNKTAGAVTPLLILQQRSSSDDVVLKR
jgi:hypothetical protein